MDDETHEKIETIEIEAVPDASADANVIEELALEGEDGDVLYEELIHENEPLVQLLQSFFFLLFLPKRYTHFLVIIKEYHLNICTCFILTILCI